MSKRTEYIAKMELQLDKSNAQMDELEAKAQEAKEDARSQYKEAMGKLRHQSKLAITKLEELKSSSEDSWENLVVDMEKTYGILTSSFLSLFQFPTVSWSHLPAGKPIEK